MRSCGGGEIEGEIERHGAISTVLRSTIGTVLQSTIGTVRSSDWSLVCGRRTAARGSPVKSPLSLSLSLSLSLQK